MIGVIINKELKYPLREVVIIDCPTADFLRMNTEQFVQVLDGMQRLQSISAKVCCARVFINTLQHFPIEICCLLKLQGTY